MVKSDLQHFSQRLGSLYSKISGKTLFCSKNVKISKIFAEIRRNTNAVYTIFLLSTEENEQGKWISPKLVQNGDSTTSLVHKGTHAFCAVD